jgi:hypothetical protein
VSSFDLIASSTATLAEVNSITGNTDAAAAAAGYAAFIQSIGGDAPQVIDLGDKRARLPMTNKDMGALRSWLDEALKPSAIKPVVEYDFGAALTPWILKYAIPASIVVFIIGYFSGKTRRRR